MTNTPANTEADPRRGWSWFERPEKDVRQEYTHGNGLTEPERVVRQAYARCFSTTDGQQVLKHLRTITTERALGPEASTELLRHVEGQRQLVSYIASLMNRGRNGS